MPKDNKSSECCCIHSTEDHRVIGERLEIFDFDNLVGSGMPLWLENGHIIREIVKEYVNSVQKKYGIKMVSTPPLGRKELYETSGHWDHYRENIFPPIKLDEGDEYVLRPMTCPHHILLYKKTNRHEKHLPIAYGENSPLYRYESSGGLLGLERTRCMELIDTHIFCSKQTLNNSLQQALNIILEVQKAFDIEYDSVILAVRDSSKDKFFDDNSLWEETESILTSFMERNDMNYEIGKGDAAFYGPKIDFQIKTHLGKIITISTIQLDFLLPKRFELSYLTGEQGDKETPIMIHLGIIGTLERFTSYLLERDNGWLPFWLSPIQIAIIPINPEKHLEPAQRLSSFFNKLNVRTSIEEEKESLSKRMAKIINKRAFGHVVIGDKEIELVDKLTSSIEGMKEEANRNWNKVIELFKYSRGDREGIKGKTYPEGYKDIFNWSYIKT